MKTVYLADFLDGSFPPPPLQIFCGNLYFSEDFVSSWENKNNISQSGEKENKIDLVF